MQYEEDTYRMDRPSITLGTHVIADFYGAGNLYSCADVPAVLREAAQVAAAAVLDIKLHDFGDRAGFTGVALLAESHISIHTWPEHDYCALDIFMCGASDPLKSLSVLRRYFAPGRENVEVLKRGSVAAFPLREHAP